LFVESGKTLLFVMGRDAVCGCNDGRNEKFLVNVNAATDWINYFQNMPPLKILGEEKALTEPPHI